MADVPEVVSSDPTEVLAAGRRHLAVKDYPSAVSSLGKACELLAQKHGDQADECGEAYLWYGKALLGLSREESGVLGDGIGGTKEEGENDEEGEGAQDEEEEEGEENEQNGHNEENEENAQGEGTSAEPSTTKAEENENEVDEGDNDNEAANHDESVADLGDEDDVENLQLAWEMLELSRSILSQRVESKGSDAARALLAEVHLTLGEVALESETYDKAVTDMEHCLEIQKKLYGPDDRRIAETHYQIGLANSLSSNFEDSITHFRNAANILESRIKNLENPAAGDDATVKKYAASDPFYSIAGEVKELKELLPEIREKIQDMIDYKAGKGVRLCGGDSQNAEGYVGEGA